jgi:hypothetical protein
MTDFYEMWQKLNEDHGDDLPPEFQGAYDDWEREKGAEDFQKQQVGHQADREGWEKVPKKDPIEGLVEKLKQKYAQAQRADNEFIVLGTIVEALIVLLEREVGK